VSGVGVSSTGLPGIGGAAGYRFLSTILSSEWLERAMITHP